ncbi:phosphatidylinositol 4-kinase [Histoplasma capsulatum var. duboisii H88]|uniref:1-phosphatidylinositol 4-kinase n=1 Tax=Ajellomyces capsulatus (strain H88) TaxID=544711 RepID=A0A8A1LTY2_AJEC8|nr:phosphatidylinositol 4-kinase [Histoplasma capsulatum var. duboisii H88]
MSPPSLPSYLRRAAFDKLAELATSFPGNDGDIVSDVDRLGNACNRPKLLSSGYLDGVSRSRPSPTSPLTIRELDALLALCRAASKTSPPKPAAKLISQLAAYLPDSHLLLLHASPFLYSIKPSPWEALTYNLTISLLSLGSRFPRHRDDVLQSVMSYLANCIHATKSLPALQNRANGERELGDFQAAVNVASITVSLMGFLEAASVHASFWQPKERLKIVNQLRLILSEQFLITVETVSSMLRSSESSDRILLDWRRYARRYASGGRPLGAMLLQQGFMRFIKASTSPAGADGRSISESALLDQYLSSLEITRQHRDDQSLLVGPLAEIIAEQIQQLEDGSDYLQLGSAWQQRLAFSVKSFALVSFLNCAILDEDSADPELLYSWLEDTLLNFDQMGDGELAGVVLKSLAVLTRLCPNMASNTTRCFLKFIVHNGQSGATVATAAHCLATTLRLLSQDTIIGTLYTLGNFLSSGPTADKSHQLTADGIALHSHSRSLAPPFQNTSNGSVISLTCEEDAETTITYRNVVHAIITISTSCKDSKIVALAQSMLLQKIGKISVVVNACIIEETAALALHSDEAEFRVLLKFYSRIYSEALSQANTLMLDAVQKARNHLAVNANPHSVHYRVYLIHLLESIVNKGDATDTGKDHQKDVELSAEEIIPLVKPLAILFSRGQSNWDSLVGASELDIPSLLRDLWFNIVVHGISLHSENFRQYYQELRILAVQSAPLVAENRTELLESDIELNTVLRRGATQNHATEQRKNLAAELPHLEQDIRRLGYPKTVFLNATLLIESLRAASGDCTKVLTYFLDPALNSTDVGSCMNAIADKVVSIYLEKSLSGSSTKFSASYISAQLADTFMSCCHRIEKVQQVATSTASKIINQCPSSLCQKRSLFVLLDLLTIMWSSCLDEELDEFEWKSTFTSARGVVQVELSDNYDFRRHTFTRFYRLARTWVSTVMNIAPLDVKGLLQTYLSDYEDDGAYGHISMGRSFALEMGSAIPSSDQRLGSIECNNNSIVNVASDFISQYTTRQEYRYSEAPRLHRQGWIFPLDQADSTSSAHLNTIQSMEAMLVELESRISEGQPIALDTCRNLLRKATALICSSREAETSIISHLVNIPFQIFTRESIKMGISLWLGAIHENPHTEPRILTEVAQAWERTIHRKLGIFNPTFKFTDPFMTKTEFSPSDKAVVLKRQQKAQNIISPHFRILQFFESHFNATRLGSVHTQRIFSRLVGTTLVSLQNTTGHPLAREIHFHIVLFGLKVLRYCTSQTKIALWKLKDQILSAALSWFSHPPRWSLGGNRLQMKAEDKLLQDIECILESTARIASGSSGARKSLQTKQELVKLLIDNERFRLRVWLSPLEHERRHYTSSSGNKVDPEVISPLMRLAWAENHGLALQLANRFPSPKLRSDVRWLLLNFPEKAICDPDSLNVLLGSELPPDVSFQLKYLLFWAPVNPIEAATYFLPAYRNHPFILQYAMRSLESHSVDVSFFYIPQLVQALRYDALGYVERYIFETAQLSQLFAHQVIWNMKANAYKDEDSQIPDPIKPVLDQFLDKLMIHFSEEDRAFYEREFSFFNEITGISGKLRPYIKRSKPEKKQKIEEELRKVKVEVGVYLPSNPDGEVIGIDRKSGKPLQSHAKAPYMATFRIKKTKKVEENGNGNPATMPTVISDDAQRRESVNDSVVQAANTQESELTYEVWQSAIFKVGDDCRQDVLALQMIAAFRSIFMGIGLDVFVYPYRVTATAPGCGVIDVLPNSISRDMLGREAVNGLYDYFISKYGGEQSTRFQEARSNFVKSMAAYSVISYLLQFKDRHNGNIMIDDAGHIIHIDFGFCFDIAPGGVRFERAPFKLTSEMVAVMGGQNAHSGSGGSSSTGGGGSGGGISLGSSNPTNSQSYRWFESLVAKAFLASRPYATKLSHIVTLMLDSGLPCFKPDTLKNFKDRFVLEKTEREAADYMRDLVKKSYMSMSTKGYDQFQLLTNNIPY